MRAKLDQARTTLKVASCILPRIRLIRGFIEDVAVGVIVIGIDFAAAAAAGQAHGRTQPVEEVVVFAAVGQAFIHEQATATTGVVGGAAGV